MRESRKSLLANVTTSATAYTAADQVGGLITLESAVDVPGGPAILESLTVIDKEKIKADLTVFFFSRNPTLLSVDNAALSIADADMVAYCLGKVKVAEADYSDIAASSVATLTNIQFDLNAEDKPSGTNLGQRIYAVLMVTSGTPNWSAAANLALRFGVKR